MAIKTRSNSKPGVKTKARELLAFVEKNIQRYEDPAELFIVLYGPHGKATMMFPTKTEWAAFQRTDEVKEIKRLLEALPPKSAR